MPEVRVGDAPGAAAVPRPVDDAPGPRHLIECFGEFATITSGPADDVFHDALAGYDGGTATGRTSRIRTVEEITPTSHGNLDVDPGAVDHMTGVSR